MSEALTAIQTAGPSNDKIHDPLPQKHQLLDKSAVQSQDSCLRNTCVVLWECGETHLLDQKCLGAV